MTGNAALRYRLAALAVLLSVGMLALTGCGNPFSDSEDEAVETVVEDETKQAVQRYAQEIAEVAGKELEPIGLHSSPCTGRFGEDSKDVYSTQGTYHIRVPEKRHIEVIAELRKLWVGRGYSVESERRSPPAPVNELDVRTPDGFDLSITNTRPPDALGILISSPCRRSPTPLF